MNAPHLDRFSVTIPEDTRPAELLELAARLVELAELALAVLDPSYAALNAAQSVTRLARHLIGAAAISYG